MRPVEGTNYDLNDVLRGCDHIAATFLNKSTGVTDESGNVKTAAQLKSDKTAQEVRKLTIENDLREGRLVKAEDVQREYAKSLKALASRLDAIPSRVKIALPDIPQQALEEIGRVLIEARNSACDGLDQDALEDL